MIERLVRAFYEAVRQDSLLGPIFEDRVADWEPHLRRMCAFWSSVALMSGEYHGRPMEKHLSLPIDAQHFDRWLALFEGTARTICPPAAADHFVERARRIAESIELGIAGHIGIRLAKGERLRRPESAVSNDDADGTDTTDDGATDEIGRFASPACLMPEIEPISEAAPLNPKHSN